MKNVSPFIILYAAASLLLFSCSQTPGLSITKRLYRNGYAVDFNSGKPLQHEKPQAIVEDDQNKELPVSALLQTPKVDNDAIQVEPRLANSTIINSSEEGGDHVLLTVKNDAARDVHWVKPALASAEKAIHSTKKSFVNSIFSKDLPVNESRKAFRYHHADVDSVLWTIISILIILCIISFLMGGWGVGGFIYLLLIVSLALLLFRLFGRR